MHDHAAVRAILFQLLSSKEPELGARLKQRIAGACLRDGLGRFDEKALGFKRFSDYLKNVHGDVVEISRSSDQADIFVSLRIASGDASTPFGSISTPTPVVRSDVWTAFANPDPSRKRFLHKGSAAILHFIDGDGSSEQNEVEGASSDYIEIHPIPGPTQAVWMREFLSSVVIDDNERAPIDSIVSGTYSSASNAAFTRLLAERGAAWRLFRTSKVVEFIRTWAEQNSISMSRLLVENAVSATASRTPQAKPQHGTSAREQAMALLNLISDEDIGRVVLPIMVSTMLVRQRS